MMTNEKRNIDFYTLVSRVLSEDITSEGQEKLNEYLKDSFYKSEYESLLSIWEKSDNSFSDINLDMEWEKISNHISKKTRFLQSTLIFKIASVIVIGFMLGLGLTTYLNSPKEFVAGNHPIELELPDGSKVDLNKNSSISYKRNFRGKERNVELKGEAFFSVTKNENKPFIVRTNNLRVKVLGTSFLVSAYENSYTSDVFVKSGLVEVSDNKNEAKKIQLKENEGVELDKNERTLKEKTLISDNYLAWKTQKLSFRNQELCIVINTLSDFYNKEFIIEDEDLKKSRITTTFDNKEIKEVLDILEITLSIDTELEGDKIYLKRR